jgi:hypothetical protein
MRKYIVRICSLLVVLFFLLCGASSAVTDDLSTTRMENQPPDPPVITGPSSGKPNTRYYYDFYITDPDGDDLKAILIEWGGQDSDNTTYICWLCEGGPLPNGSTFEYFHDWGSEGSYTIRAKIWDMQDNESDWGTFTVTMPCSSYQPAAPFFEILFQRFPHAFPLLRQILGY